MNARIQVEHNRDGRMVTGLDLVREQVLIRGRESRSRFGRRDVHLHGHALECRINAEGRSRTGSCPRPGTITRYVEPRRTGVSGFDSGVQAGSEESHRSTTRLIAKLVVHDVDRETGTAGGCCGRSTSS